MPSIPGFKPWLFSLAVLALISILSVVDRRYLKLRPEIAYWPVPLFVITQLFAWWLNETTTRA
jgi:hypothetical protein